MNDQDHSAELRSYLVGFAAALQQVGLQLSPHRQLCRLRIRPQCCISGKCIREKILNSDPVDAGMMKPADQYTIF